MLATVDVYPTFLIPLCEPRFRAGIAEAARPAPGVLDQLGLGGRPTTQPWISASLFAFAVAAAAAGLLHGATRLPGGRP